MKIQELYKLWCKDTKRSGGVLVGSSIQEFFTWLDDNGYSVGKGWYVRHDDEIKDAKINGYEYIIP